MIYVKTVAFKGHTDEIYVLEPHPINKFIMLSAGHDGNLILWDIVQGTQKKKFFNEVIIMCNCV